MDRDEAYEAALKALLEGEDVAPAGRGEAEAGTSLAALRVLGAIQSTARRLLFGPDAAERPTASWGALEIRDEIGRGASSTVFRAWDTRLNREVALKLIDPDSTSADAALAEGRLLARLRHPNVVTVYGVDTCHDVAGLWMELVQGDTLDDLIQRDGPFSLEEALLAGIDLAQALAAVHGAGMLHRDIKARNVVRQRGGRLVLMDFGAGRWAGPPAAAGDGAGTPLYMAPEVLEGAPASAQSDIYGLGVLLHYLITGTYPVVAPDLGALRAAHRLNQRDALGPVDDVPPATRVAIQRATAADDEARFTTAQEFEGALTEALREVLATRARVVPVGVRRWRRLRRRVWATSAALLALLLGGWLGWDTTPGRAVRRAAGLPVPPRSVLYFTYGGGIGVVDGRRFRVFEGSAGGALALAVSEQHGIRPLASAPLAVPGAWLRLDGTQQAPVVDPAIPLCCYLDGTTDGRFNYALRQDEIGLGEPIGSRPLAPPALHRFDLDWRNREVLFELDETPSGVTAHRYFGLAYHAASDTFWVTRLVPDGTAHVEHWSRAGRRLHSFPVGAQSRAIAVDPADGTAWLMRYTLNDSRLHFDNIDHTGRPLGTYTIPQPLTGIGSAGMEFAWPAR